MWRSSDLQSAAANRSKRTATLEFFARRELLEEVLNALEYLGRVRLEEVAGLIGETSAAHPLHPKKFVRYD